MTTKRKTTKKTVAKKPAAKKTNKSTTYYVVDKNGRKTNMKISLSK